MKVRTKRAILTAFMLLDFIIMCGALCAVEYNIKGFSIEVMYWAFGLSLLGIIINMYGLSKFKE